MRKCLKCDKTFPWRIWVNGILKSLSTNRKYCLECSPFGEHNTKILDDKPKVNKKKSWNPKYNKYRIKMKQKAVEYKGGKCQVCGYNKCIQALQFHHLDPTHKDFSIAHVTRSWEGIKKEIDKCILVCGNCHVEIHNGLIKCPHLK